MSKAKEKPTPTSQDSIPWPHRIQVTEFPDLKGFVFVPPTSSDGEMVAAFARAAREQLGFEETTDPSGANFIIVGDGTKGTTRPDEEATTLILKQAKDNNTPILSVSILELYQRLLIGGSLRQTGVKHFTLEEAKVNGRTTLTMGEDFFRYAEENEDGAYDELGRQQLLKDDYVRYVGGLHHEQKQRLGKFLDFVPLRLIGTRWKVHMVLNRYLALAWEISGDTWKFVFHEEDFVREYKGLFGNIAPDDALRASILAFIEDPDIYFS